MDPQPRQFIPLPQAEFIEAYLDQTSPQFLNVQEAATKANIPVSEAKRLLARKEQWIKELQEEHPMLQKAEENLATFLDISPYDEDHSDQVLKASMFVAERLGKHKYSTRQELTGENGKALIPKEEVEMRLINLRTKQIE